VTRANYERIGLGMTRQEVEELLGGPPTDGFVASGYAVKVWYHHPGRWVVVTFDGQGRQEGRALLEGPKDAGGLLRLLTRGRRGAAEDRAKAGPRRPQARAGTGQGGAASAASRRPRGHPGAAPRPEGRTGPASAALR
jgi:hypothetical protein